MATLREAFEAFGRKDHERTLGEGSEVCLPGQNPVYEFARSRIDPDHPATQHLVIQSSAMRSLLTPVFHLISWMMAHWRKYISLKDSCAIRTFGLPDRSSSFAMGCCLQRGIPDLQRINLKVNCFKWPHPASLAM